MVSPTKHRLVALELLAVAVMLIASCGPAATSSSDGGTKQQVTSAATAFGHAFWQAHYAEAVQYAVPNPNPLLNALDDQDGPTGALTSDDAKVANVKVAGSSATFDFVGTFCGTTSSKTTTFQGGGSGGPGQSSSTWSSSTVITNGNKPPRRCVTNAATSGDVRFRYRAVKNADGAWYVEVGKPR